MRTRIDLFTMMKDEGLTGLGVEVGVMCGTFSAQILRAWTGTLFCVDSWRQRDDYPEIANVPNSQHLDALVKTYMVTNEYGDRCNILKMSSIEAAKRFQDRELDFVYIDANHSFYGCSTDLEWWWCKVKQGGIVAGHDYHNEKREWGQCGVKEAVENFHRKHKFPIDSINVINEADPTWWVRV